MSTEREPPALVRSACRYQPYYCEENVWQLCREPALAHLERTAVFVTNAQRTCALWHQRAGHPVVWDYHVVLLTRPDTSVWDLDTTLPFPCPAHTWLEETFGGLEHVPPSLHPRFRLVPAATLLARFASDRRHMRGPGGAWFQPPPPWPPIAPPEGSATHTLEDFLDLGRPVGDDDRVVDLDGLRAALR